jgi:hypothetical protein
MIPGRFLLCFSICAASICAPMGFCQATPAPGGPAGGGANRVIPAPAPATVPEQLPRRLFGIIPNYRSHPSFRESKPLTAKEKFRLGARDSFDPGTFLLAGAIAGISQASNSTPSYGQGMAGYGRYYGASYGNLVIGDMMTTAVFPSLLHQDPRYFRRGTGSTWSRLEYACGQIFITHGDNRKTQFNYSEILGNSTAVAISNAYDPDNRTASDAVGALAFQLGLDMAGNILKEFVPDVYRRFSHKRHH